VIPIYLQADLLTSKLSSCKTKLSSSVLISGYSEGAYATIAVADALRKLDMDVIKAYADGGPYKLSGVQYMEMFKNIESGKFPNSSNYLLALVSSAYSTTNYNLPNFNMGQNLVSDKFFNTTSFDCNVSFCTSDINSLIPENDVLSLINPDLVLLFKVISEANKINPCYFQLEARMGATTKLCDALKENDLAEIILQQNFNYVLCHSEEDEINTINNILTSIKQKHWVSVLGNHETASINCMKFFFDEHFQLDYKINTESPLEELNVVDILYEYCPMQNKQNKKKNKNKKMKKKKEKKAKDKGKKRVKRSNI